MTATRLRTRKSKIKDEKQCRVRYCTLRRPMAAERRLLAAAHRWREGVATEAVVAPASEAAPQLEPLELTILGCTSDSEGATLPLSLGAVCSAWTSQHLLPASERMVPNRALRPVLRYWARHTDAQWLEELKRSSDRCVVRLPLTHSNSFPHVTRPFFLYITEIFSVQRAAVRAPSVARLRLRHLRCCALPVGGFGAPAGGWRRTARSRPAWRRLHFT